MATLVVTVFGGINKSTDLKVILQSMAGLEFWLGPTIPLTVQINAAPLSGLAWLCEPTYEVYEIDPPILFTTKDHVLAKQRQSAVLQIMYNAKN
jgi:hypothetical protein